MCGIAGWIYKNQNQKAEKERIKKMTDAIAHRGPDAEGAFLENNVALGHRRLSIIDLSEDGNQPMFSHDDAYVIVFNGEIYNYLELKEELIKLGAIFKNNTDTEVIIEAYRYWGQECVKRFNGMWAFCLYDKEKNDCFLSRDRFGIKPLYILDRGDVFAFASEAKAILAGFPEENIPDYDMVYRYLWGGVLEDQDEKTFYRNIKRFEQSYSMIYHLDTNQYEKVRYWKVDEEEFRKKWIIGKDPVKTCKELLEDSVKLRMRADVEVGSCLSGGLDSSAIVGICKKKFGLTMHTFSSIYSDKDCNEKEYIDAVNSFNQTIPHLIYPEPEKNSLLDAFQKILYHHDGPNSGASLYSQYSVMQGIHGNVKVVLDGQGADELFGGYLAYYGDRLLDILRENTWRSRLAAIKTMAILTKQWPWVISSIQSDAMVQALGMKQYRKMIKKYKQQEIIRIGGNHPLFTKEFIESVNKEVSFSENKITGVLNSRLCKEVIKDSIPELLHNEDGNSMAFSIESRVPFLDYRLVEFGLVLDSKYKIRNEWTKWIIRQSCKEYLPKKVARRKNKMGFPAPFARWLRECEEKEQMKELIYALGERNIVPKETIDFYYQEHMSKKADRNQMLYKFMVLEMWLRTCNV